MDLPCREREIDQPKAEGSNPDLSNLIAKETEKDFSLNNEESNPPQRRRERRSSRVIKTNLPFTTHEKKPVDMKTTSRKEPKNRLNLNPTL